MLASFPLKPQINVVPQSNTKRTHCRTGWDATWSYEKQSSKFSAKQGSVQSLWVLYPSVWLILRKSPERLALPSTFGHSFFRQTSMTTWSSCKDPPSRWSKPTPPQAGQDLSSSPARCEGTAFVFNPNAPAFDPAIPFVGHMPENVQDLYHAWQQTAFSWEGESASTNIITWFVDQHNLALHHCHAPRVVRLYDNFQQWEAHLRQVWREFTLPGAPIMIHVV